MPSLSDRVRSFCSSTGLKMNTDLGQHFLIDEAVLSAILETADIQPNETIVEIGPGIGILTQELLERTPNVIAIEIDQKLIPFLHMYISQTVTSNKPTIVNANALAVPFPSSPYKIVANIPYHITSPLLRHAFLEGTVRPTSLTLLIQREVAEKICETHDRSLLTIIVGLFGEPQIITRVPPKSFLPPPKVDSAVLHIQCYPEPKATPEIIERVFTLTKHAFSQKRKMLRNTIADLPGGREALLKTGIDPMRRPQTLSVEEWVQMAKVEQ